MKRYAINGKFYSQRITGVQRFARELLLELDCIIKKDEIVVICAHDAIDVPEFKNIKIIKIGKTANQLWVQTTFPIYALLHGLVTINLCGSGPLISPGIVCMHDIGFLHYPEYVTKRFIIWGIIQIFNAEHRAKGLITVSEFSRKDIENMFPRMVNKFTVVPNAWQHMDRVGYDDTIFDRYNNLQEDNYFFSMSSLTPNKNIKWILNTAKMNPDELFVIAGSVNEKLFGKMNILLPKNVLLLGYVTDEEAKSLMAKCKAFIFPTFFEGFGIPPLEALACGCNKIIVSNTECMHEIYGDYAYYIDPNKPIENINDFLSKEVIVTENPLSRYNWNKSAKILKEYLKL